jgi:hypothetical protein
MRKVCVWALVVSVLLAASVDVCAGSPVAAGGDDLHPLEDVAYYAAFQMKEFTRTDETGEFQSWQGATIGEITLVRDATGDPVLYDVIVENNGRPVGLIQIWAKKLMGVPFHTVSTSTVLLDLRLRASEACEIATETLGEIEITDTEMVYYQFPKLAFAVTFRRGGETEMALVDVSSQTIIPGDQVVPFMSTLSAEALRESRHEWEQIRELLDRAEEPTPMGLGQKLLDVPLWGQQYSYYCGPAVVRMIFHYWHGWSKGQDYYANLLGTTPEYGTPWENYGPAWLTLGHATYSMPYKASWSTVVGEINSNRPFQSHIVGHVRAAIGYRDLGWWKYVGINDPFPTGQGDFRWEGYSEYWAGTILVY